MENNLNLNLLSEPTQAEKLGPASSTHRVKASHATAPQATTETHDTAEFSEIARMLSLATETSPVRADRVAELKAALRTDEQQFIHERLAATVDCLCDELNNS